MMSYNYNDSYAQFREQLSEEMKLVKDSTDKLDAKLRFFDSPERRDNPVLREQIEQHSRSAGEEGSKVTALFKRANQDRAGHGIFGEGAEANDFEDLSQEFYQIMNSLAEVERTFKKITNPNKSAVSGPGGDYAPPSMGGGGGGYAPPSMGGIQASHDGLQLDLVYSGDSIDQEIANENREAAMYVARESTAIKDAMQDMKQLLGQQREKLEHVDEEIEDTTVVVKEADKQLEKAQEHQKAKKKIIIVTIIVVVIIVLLGIAALLIYLALETDVFKPPKKRLLRL